MKEDVEFICKNHDLVFIDTKKKIDHYCKECSYIKINEDESNNSKDYIVNNRWTKEKIITTLGNRGCEYNGKIYSVERVEIKDLCGAGDTFLAALAVKYLETKNIDLSIEYANKCATIVVQKKGVNTI